MGGACSRRLHPRHANANALSSEGGAVHEGAVLVRGGALREHPGYTLRDGFVGPGTLSGPRALRVWPSSCSLGDGFDCVSPEGSARSGHSHALGGCLSRARSGSPKRDQQVQESGGNEPEAPALAFEGLQCCSLHGSLCPALPRPTLQERCLAVLCCQLHEVPETVARQLMTSLTKDMSQRCFDAWVDAGILTLPLLRSLARACLEEAHLGGYPGVSDKWLQALRAQAETLLYVDLSHCEAVTDVGVLQLLHASRLRSLCIDMCLQISDDALVVLEGCQDLRSLSCRGCVKLTAKGLRHLASLTSLQVLDLERCSEIHGGMAGLAALTSLRVLNLGWCRSVTDADVEVVAEFELLEVLHLSRTRVSDRGILRLQGLTRMRQLSLAGCDISDACFPAIACMTALTDLNCEWCADVSSACLQYIRLLPQLKVLNLGYTNVKDGHASLFSELGHLEELSLDSCAVSEASVAQLADIPWLRCLDLSDTVVGNEGLRHMGRMRSLEVLNLSFTSVTDDGMRALASLPSLRVLNIDSRLITDRALASLSALTGLRSLDLFGAKISDAGLAHLKVFKGLESLEVCGGGITDGGVRHLASLTALTSLNLSQNLRLTDAGVAPLAALSRLERLNLSSCKITGAALVHLRSLPHLRSLALHSCRVSRCALTRTLSSPLCLWPKDLVVSGVQ